MARENQKIIHNSEISNNCPECFNQNIQLRFYQKHLFSTFFHKITSVVTHQLKCETCESIIYPINWTPDIERSVAYNQKMVKPEKASVRFTGAFYGLVLLIVALLGVAYYFMFLT